MLTFIFIDTLRAIIGGIIGGAVVFGLTLVMIIGCIIFISRRSRYNSEFPCLLSYL